MGLHLIPLAHNQSDIQLKILSPWVFGVNLQNGVQLQSGCIEIKAYSWAKHTQKKTLTFGPLPLMDWVLISSIVKRDSIGWELDCVETLSGAELSRMWQSKVMRKGLHTFWGGGPYVFIWHKQWAPTVKINNSEEHMITKYSHSRTVTLCQSFKCRFQLNLDLCFWGQLCIITFWVS